jgi:serine/threonine protein kinase
MAAVSRFQRVERLGEGAYGVVYKAQDRETHEFVALKRIPLDNAEEVPPCSFPAVLAHSALDSLLLMRCDLKP